MMRGSIWNIEACGAAKALTWPTALYWLRDHHVPVASELLKLPAGERADLAMALWQSLSGAEREAEFK